MAHNGNRRSVARAGEPAHCAAIEFTRGESMRIDGFLARLAPGLIAAGLVLGPAVALAGHLKPGLWRVTTTIDLGAAARQIPPEQLARLQSMGIKVPTPGQAFSTDQCVTPEMAARDVPPHMGRNDSGCSAQNQKSSAAGISADLVCNGAMKGQGAMQLTYADDHHYSGGFSFKGVSAGHQVDIKSTIAGEWQSAACK
jgi:Protein of unknown function (DUF3617)